MEARYEVKQSERKTVICSRFIKVGLHIICLFLAVQSLVACKETQKPSQNQESVAMPVGIITAQKQPLPVTVEATGQAEGSLDVEVRARVSGIVEQKLYEEGMKLKAGAPMFRIERAPYEIALQQAKAALAQKTTQLEQTRREVQRLKPLAESKAVSQREFDDAVTNERMAESALASAKSSVREAELNLSYTLIKSPISGVSGRSMKSQGALVTAGSDSLIGTVTQTNPIWVRFSLTESELAHIRESRKAEVRLLNEDGTVYFSGGKLNFTGSNVDTKNGTVQLRAEFRNPELKVLPGQFVRVQLLSGQMAAYKVPKSAVVQNEQGRSVWVIRNGKATVAPVETGAWIGGDWVIYKGLADGDQIIIDNLMKLSPDAAVAPQIAAPAAIR